MDMYDDTVDFQVCRTCMFNSMQDEIQNLRAAVTRLTFLRNLYSRCPDDAPITDCLHDSIDLVRQAANWIDQKVK